MKLMADQPSLLNESLRFVVKVMAVAVLVLLITGLVCWFGGWHTWREFGDGLFYAGVATMGIGLLSIMGSTRFGGDAKYNYMRSAGAGTLHERSDQVWKDIFDSYNFVILMAAAGVAVIAIGWVISAYSSY